MFLCVHIYVSACGCQQRLGVGAAAGVTGGYELSDMDAGN